MQIITPRPTYYNRTAFSNFKNNVLSCPNSFVSLGLDKNLSPTPVFNMKGIFLESSVNAKIKSVPIFIFSLQRHEAMGTFISCFYAEDHPTLFSNFHKDFVLNDKGFFFNWFDHKAIVPNYPPHRDEISNVFYFNEGRLLDYRIFDSTVHRISKVRKFFYSNYFKNKTSIKKGFVYRNRFYKRKFDWFLKHHA